MTQTLFNERLRQIIILGLITLLIVALIKQLSIFIAGILGAVTLYILARKQFFRWVFKHKWKPAYAAMLWMFIFFIVVATPIYLSITMVSPKVSEILSDPEKITNSVKAVASKVESATGIKLIKADTMNKLTEKITTMVPGALNSTASIVTNLVMMFFLFYYLLVNGRQIEKLLHRVIPLKSENINILASETRMMVSANALGIPIISVIQGIVATIGYWIFGINDWGMWGFVTGVFAFFPFVGTMIIWVPLAISMFVGEGSTAMAIGFLLYHVLITGNVDYLARMTLMRKLGDVHPVITVLGVIIGLNMFGFIGLIFGPLLLSYVIVMVKIYMNEFADIHAIPKELSTETKVEDEVQGAKQNLDSVSDSIDKINDMTTVKGTTSTEPRS